MRRNDKEAGNFLQGSFALSSAAGQASTGGRPLVVASKHHKFPARLWLTAGFSLVNLTAVDC